MDGGFERGPCGWRGALPWVDDRFDSTRLLDVSMGRKETCLENSLFD